jgi:hypothetical protein
MLFFFFANQNSRFSVYNKTKKTASFEAVFVPFTVELSNLFIQDLMKLSHAYMQLTKGKTFQNLQKPLRRI